MKAKKSARAKPWQGRFSGRTSTLLEEFTASVHFDCRLYDYDIRGSIAYARALEKAGVLSAREKDQIIRGLETIREEIERGDFEWSSVLEDVHMNIEARLIELVGDTGKKLHTGRSRNDQVATDFRMYLRDELDKLREIVIDLQKALVLLAERETDTVMPGYTHLQAAQPVSFGHHVLAWYEMLKRDCSRIAEARRRLNVMPLGSAALAGSGVALDRAYLAELLDFDSASDNSLDAVSDRDFAIDVCAACAVLMMHLSRFSEELVLWTTQEFGFVELPDEYCTGSSIMPQKKNPDGPELVRGKTGRVYGHLQALLTLMKGQPLAYNRDNQEDKEPVFDTLDTAKLSLRIITEIIRAMKVKRERMARAAEAGYLTATDLADYLAGKGIAFRDAHAVVGQIVKLACEHHCSLADLELESMRAVCSEIDQGVYEVLTVRHSLSSRDCHGGTAAEQVRARVAEARRYLKM